MIELRAVKKGCHLDPWSDEDRQALARFEDGKVLKATITAPSARSLQHLRLYWGGLLGLALEYWVPVAGVLSPSETALIKAYTKEVEKAGNAPGALAHVEEAFFERVKERRAAMVSLPPTSKQSLHDWIMVELGRYDLQSTPAGVKKVPHSISFASMGQEEFDEFYKAAFGVVWSFIMSRIFDSEEQVQQAVMAKLEQMG